MLILEDPDVELESDKISDDPMKNFIRFLDDDGNGNETTLRQYPKRLKYFFDSVWTKKDDKDEYKEFVRLDATIDDQAKEFVRYYKDKGEGWVKGAFLRMVKVHKKRVEKGEIVDGTIFNYYKAGRRFCDANGIKMDDWSTISKKVPTGRKSGDDRIPTEGEIKKLVAYPDLRIKGIIYTMLSSGVRRSSWKYMKWKHIEPHYDENGKVLCAKLTARNIKWKGKGEKWYYTFITPEAYFALLEYRKHRERHGEIVDRDSWVMVHKDDPTVQLSPFGIKAMIERAAKNAKLFTPLKKNEKRREWQLTHAWRKYFSTRASEVMDSLIVELCLDHETGLAENYIKDNEPTRRANYLKAVPLLTIEDGNKNVDKITVEVTRTVTQDLTSKYEKQTLEMKKMMEEQLLKQRADHLLYMYEQEKESLADLIADNYERYGKNISPAPPDIPKNVFLNLLEETRKSEKDPNLKLEEMAFITRKMIIERLKNLDLNLSNADFQILDVLEKNYDEDDDPYGIEVFFALPNELAYNLDVTVDEIRNRWKKKENANQ